MNINAEAIEVMPVDISKLDRLRIVMKDDYSDALESFLKQSRIYIDAISTAIYDRRTDDAMGIAHKLKSSSGLYGFWKVSKFCAAIEHSKIPYDTPAMMASHAELADAFQEALVFMNGQIK